MRIETNISTFLCSGCGVRRPVELYNIMSVFYLERMVDAVFCSPRCKERVVENIKKEIKEKRDVR